MATIVRGNDAIRILGLKLEGLRAVHRRRIAYERKVKFELLPA